VLVVHAGNRVDAPDRPRPRFPEADVPWVSARAGRLLDLLRPQGVVTAAAAGADLLLIREALQRGIAVHVVLPFDRHTFRDLSVADLGNSWGAEYDRVLAAVTTDTACSLVEHDFAPDDVGFKAGNACLVERARELAGDDVVAVVVRPFGGEEPPRVTDGLVTLARAEGWFVVEIDPRRPESTTGPQ
jgi:hypothetical protein